MSPDAAVEAAKRDMHVFPVFFKNGTKHPAVKWRDEATTDIEQIHAWWAGRSYPAYGIECEKSGIVVVDEDTLDEFQRLADQLGQTLPDTYVVRTGRATGGRQFHFTNPLGVRSTDLRSRGFNIDIKGAGGYVVGVGSGHPSGRTYQVERDNPLIPFPTWLAEFLAEAGTANGWTNPDLAELVEHGIPKGQGQDVALAHVAWKLCSQHVDRAVAYGIWQAIVTRTALTDPSRPFTVQDFDRHWDGAVRKIGEGPTVLDDEPAARPRNKLTDRLFSREQLRQLPAPEPLINDTLDRRTVAVLAGPYGSLKSFLIVSWACSIATGTPWLGRPAHRGKALIIAAEGATGVDQRIAAWEDKHGLAVPDGMLSVLAQPVNLLDRGQVRELCDIVTGTTFVAVDTLARCAVGGDENSARDMGLIVEALYQIRDATGDGVATAAHHVPVNGGRPRGSSALEGGVDTIYLTDGGPAQMTLTREKRKDGPREDTRTLYLELRKTSGVVADKQADMTNAADTLLSVFMSAFGQTGASKAELRAAADMAPATFYRSLNSLLTLGILVNGGTDKRPHYQRAGLTHA